MVPGAGKGKGQGPDRGIGAGPRQRSRLFTAFAKKASEDADPPSVGLAGKEPLD
jgi:hypothetical protein